MLTASGSQNASLSARRYGAVQAGLSWLVESHADATPQELIQLVQAMAEDYASGSFDGLDANGAALELAIAITPAEAKAGLETAISAFLLSDRNLSGLLSF